MCHLVDLLGDRDFIGVDEESVVLVYVGDVSLKGNDGESSSIRSDREQCGRLVRSGLEAEMVRPTVQ